MASPTWRDALRDPEVERHVVHLYRDPAFLARAVAVWVAEPLRRGGGALLACTPLHARLVHAALRDEGVDPVAMEARGRLVVISADGLLARFMFGGRPDEDAFRRAAGEALQGIRAACGGKGAEVRAWGEMVDLLRRRGNPEAARSLEALWNGVIEAEGIRLLCSYGVDNLAPGTHARVLHEVCEGHARLIPEEDEARFDEAVALALEEVLGGAAARALLGAEPTRLRLRMPRAEAALVVLRETRPRAADRVLAAARRRLLAAGGA